MINTDHWNKCDICGQYISFEDFLEGRAKRELVEPLNEFGPELWNTYHLKCDHE